MQVTGSGAIVPLQSLLSGSLPAVQPTKLSSIGNVKVSTEIELSSRPGLLDDRLHLRMLENLPNLREELLGVLLIKGLPILHHCPVVAIPLQDTSRFLESLHQERDLVPDELISGYREIPNPIAVREVLADPCSGGLTGDRWMGKKRQHPPDLPMLNIAENLLYHIINLDGHLKLGAHRESTN